VKRYLPRDATQRGYATVDNYVVCMSVCLRRSVTVIT